MEGCPVRSGTAVVAEEEDNACAYRGFDLRAIILGIEMPFWACCWRLGCWRSSTPSASRSAE
jgi:hypothetical protein